MVKRPRETRVASNTRGCGELMSSGERDRLIDEYDWIEGSPPRAPILCRLMTKRDLLYKKQLKKIAG